MTEAEQVIEYIAEQIKAKISLIIDDEDEIDILAEDIYEGLCELRIIK